MRSMVEGFCSFRRTPPPRFAQSPSPANAGEDLRPARYKARRNRVSARLVGSPVHIPSNEEEIGMAEASDERVDEHVHLAGGAPAG
jgi:hypothetical protein